MVAKIMRYEFPQDWYVIAVGLIQLVIACLFVKARRDLLDNRFPSFFRRARLESLAVTTNPHHPPADHKGTIYGSIAKNAREPSSSFTRNISPPGKHICGQSE